MHLIFFLSTYFFNRYDTPRNNKGCILFFGFAHQLVQKDIDPLMMAMSLSSAFVAAASTNSSVHLLPSAPFSSATATACCDRFLNRITISRRRITHRSSSTTSDAGSAAAHTRRHYFYQTPVACARDSVNDDDEDAAANNAQEQQEQKRHQQKPDLDYFLTVEEGRQLISDAIALRDGSIESFARVCASGFVEAFKQCYDVVEHGMVFVAVGHGLNGMIGLHIAVELSQAGYEASVYAPYGNRIITNTTFTSTDKDSLLSSPEIWDEQTRRFCARHELSVYDFIPSTLSFYFDVVVDALLGVGYDGDDVRQYYWPVYKMLVSTDLPICSVDVPSAWDLTLGPREIDLTADTFIKPDVLVSLGAPKLGTKQFAGEFHFIAAPDLVPTDWFAQNTVRTSTSEEDEEEGMAGRSARAPPKFGKGRQSLLFFSNARPFQKMNGEVYGKPGQFNATLFTKNPRRKWVDFEEEEGDIMWDELE